MSIRTAINGFGRMGRLAMRQMFDDDAFDIVLLNDPAGDADVAAHLLNADSVQGRWEHQASDRGDTLRIADRTVCWSRETALPCAQVEDLGVDLVIECSGCHRSVDALEPYFEAGVQRVVVSAPLQGPEADHAIDLVAGVNDHLYEPDRHRIVTAASCTTNALAPIVKVIRTGLGLRHGAATTLHCVTNTQRVIDRFHKDPRRARSSALSLIPTTTGSAKAIIKIFPDLAGRLSSIAVRVPVQNTSMVDAVFEVERATDVEAVNALFRESAEGELRGILGIEDRPFVSIDYVGEDRSSVIDAPSTMVIGGTQVKVLAWYDNEWGYVARMKELAARVAAPHESAWSVAVG